MENRVTHDISIREIKPELASATGSHLGKPTHIRLEVYYSLGGRNSFSGKLMSRGYYLSATPVEISPRELGFRSIRCVLGTGIKTLLLEVNRQSDRQFRIACAIAAKAAPRFVEWNQEEYGIFCDLPAEFFPDVCKLTVPTNLPKVQKKAEETPTPVKPIRSMKLLTVDIIHKLEKHPLGSQKGKGDAARVLVKFFGGGAYTFLVTEGEKKADGDWLFFGKTTMGFGWEWCYTLLSELEKMKFPPFGLGVERDMYLSSDTTVGSAAA